jgi:hypothetical protein
MQVVGVQCALCAQAILAVTEGTWCAVCHTPFHRTCIAESGEHCPTCRAPRDDPERHVVSSRLCTKCLRLYPTPVAACGACGTGMRFPDAGALAARARELQRWARGQLLLGAGLLAGGIGAFVCMVVPLAPIPWCIAVGMVLLMLGARRIGIGRRVLRFC